jgi:hypothetical protein
MRESCQPPSPGATASAPHVSRLTDGRGGRERGAVQEGEEGGAEGEVLLEIAFAKRYRQSH